MKYGKVQTEKLYFSSGEAAKIVGVPIDVLLFWEKEFSNLKPKKNANGKRVYRKSDIEIAKDIKGKMFHDQEPTISAQSPAANKKPAKPAKKPAKEPDMEFLLKIRNDLQKTLDNLLRVHRN
jgi:DNA-binding transcriptional MerR regulator